MAILGLGTDIVEIVRMEKALKKMGNKFAQRILTAEEFVEFMQNKQPARFLAKHFAAKEATAKAIGTGIACGISFHDFSIEHDHLGKPVLAINHRALEILSQRNFTHSFLSISDESSYAIATVLLESNN